jgi:hypothetical protein
VTRKYGKQHPTEDFAAQKTTLYSLASGYALASELRVTGLAELTLTSLLLLAGCKDFRI